jgi:hypothetical protein
MILVLVLLVLAIGGILFLSQWDMPPPTRQVERDVTDAAFAD